MTVVDRTFGRFVIAACGLLVAYATPGTVALATTPARPTFAWTASQLSVGQTVPLDSLIKTNIPGRRSWNVRGKCSELHGFVTARAAGRCLVSLSIRHGSKLVVRKSKNFRVVEGMATSGLSAWTPSPTPYVWYPDGVPSRGSGRWSVPIGSYVRGKDVYPLDKTLPAAETAACEQATKVPQGVIILSFGKQVEGGTNGFGMKISYDDIARITAAWASGLARCATGPWELAVGTSNSGGITHHNGYLGGTRWAELLRTIRAIADPRITVAGANDLEPGWGPSGQARAWVDGFVRAEPSIRLWNFGSADGCPTTTTKITCGNNWTIDDVIWVSAHAGPNIVVVPQIHTTTGTLARQWARIMVRAKSMGVSMTIAGVSVQTAACAQVRGGCPTTGVSAWDAWQQMRTAVDDHIDDFCADDNDDHCCTALDVHLDDFDVDDVCAADGLALEAKNAQHLCRQMAWRVAVPGETRHLLEANRDAAGVTNRLRFTG
jgi:hypothetical protein